VTVPTASGGIQFEWHQAGLDIEIEVAHEGQAHAFLGVAGQPEQDVEGDLPDLTEDVVSTLRQLAP
jgi:hypothetical protein